MPKYLPNSIPWNKGKTGVYSVETLENFSLAKLGVKRKPFTEETLEKMRGRVHSESTKQKMRKPKSEETKRKMREYQSNRPLEHQEKMNKNHVGTLGLKGKLSPRWKGGVTPEHKRVRASLEYRLWREAVFARDEWTCKKCNKRGVALHPHHIKSFARYIELRLAIDNGITFCQQCHLKFHKKYGFGDNTMAHIMLFINSDK